MLRLIYSDGGLYRAYRVSKLINSDGGLYRAYRSVLMYSEGGLYKAYRMLSLDMSRISWHMKVNYGSFIWILYAL